MNRIARDRTGDGPPPVQRIELNEDKLHTRFILAALLLAFGVGMILFGMIRLLRAESGWWTVETGSSGPSCAGDFVFRYELGRSDSSATAEKKRLQLLYTQAAGDAYQIFHAHQLFEGVGNLASISRHPNEAVTVEPELYTALREIEADGSRWLYLAPVYEMYYSLFHSQNEVEAAEYDPGLDPDLAAWCAEAAAFARDPESVHLVLGPDSSVTLRLSEEYLAFLQEAGVTDYLDFFWAKNAFIADLIAARLTEAGFVHGYICSFDGFARNLCRGDERFSAPIYDRTDDRTYPAAVLSYDAPMALVSFHSYPTDPARQDWYYKLPDGEYRCAYIDTTDGLCKAALNDLLGYSREKGCGELALLLSPLYIRETPDFDALAALASEGIGAVWCENRTIRCTDSGAVFTDLYQDGEIVYTLP